MNPDINYYYIGKMHPYEPDITYNTIGYIAFYYLFYYMCAILMDKQKKQIADKQDDNTNINKYFKINQYQLVSLSISNNTAYSFIETNDIPDVKKQSILDNFFSMKSLERPYLLYYLFEYCDFKQYEEYYTKANFNLDETLELDTTFAIGDKQYNVDMGNLKFIAWVYYSGLYDFLMDNDKLKYEILTEMNSKGLLCGNVFLRYQLFSQEYEDYKDMPDLISQEEIDDTDNDTENDTDDDIDDDTYEIDTTGSRFNSALVDDCISLFCKIKNTIGNISNRLSRHFIKYKTIYDIK